MKTFKAENRTVDVVEAVVCNGCGLEISSDNVTYGNFMTGYYCGGYASKLGDMTEWEFDMCEKCLSDLFNNFSIKPTTVENW